jgi:hypothetical protein
MAQYLVDFLNGFQGLRKSIVMLTLIVITSVFRVKGYIGPDNFEGLLKATIVAYFGSNSVEHYTAMVKERILANNKTVAVTSIESTTQEG